MVHDLYGMLGLWDFAGGDVRDAKYLQCGLFGIRMLVIWDF